MPDITFRENLPPPRPRRGRIALEFVMADLRSQLSVDHVLFEDTSAVSPARMNCLAEAIAAYAAGLVAAEGLPIDEPVLIVEKVVTIFEPGQIGILKRIRDEAPHLKTEVDTLLGKHVNSLVSQLVKRYGYRATGDFDGLAGEFYPDFYDRWAEEYDPAAGVPLRVFMFKRVRPKALPAKVRRELGLLPPKGFLFTDLELGEDLAARAQPVDGVWRDYQGRRLEVAVERDQDITDEMLQHYVDGETLESLGGKCGQTRAAVYNRLKRSMVRIRARMNSAGLDPGT